jgi:acetyl esterase/lipase
MAHFGLSLPSVFGVLALLLAWVTPQRVWQWKLALVSREFGHWLALMCLASLAGVVRLSDARWRWNLIVISLTVSAGLLVPAMLAARATPGFSWAQLWLSWTRSDPEVSVTREVYWTQGDQSLDLLLYQPKSPGRQLMPCLLVLHTGGWESGDIEEFAESHKHLAATGLTVAVMAYRLAPRYQWPSPREDVVHAAAYLRSRASALGIDPTALYLMGRSAGGQIASACAYSLPELRIKGCILVYSPVDMFFARRYADKKDILNSLLLLRQYLGGDPENAAENYHSASAIDFVSSNVPPTLMIHGLQDTLVWVKQS